MYRTQLTRIWRALANRTVASLAALVIVLLSGSSLLASTELLRLINEYRRANGLPAISASPSLNTVAARHVADLNIFRPANMHSWSTGTYDPSNPRTWHVMWDKPRELTSYRGNGYEIAYWSSGGVTPAAALAAWKASPAHNEVLLNRGIWAGRTWRAMGAAVQGKYAVVWFGEETDPASRPAYGDSGGGFSARRVSVKNETGRRLKLYTHSAAPGSSASSRYAFTLAAGATTSFYVPIDRAVTLGAENDGAVRISGTVTMRPGMTHVARFISGGASAGPDGVSREFFSVGWTVRP